MLVATGAVDGHTTRVVEQSPPATLALKPGGTLDAEAIYAKDAPGVGFVLPVRHHYGHAVGQSRGEATGLGLPAGQER